MNPIRALGAAGVLETFVLFGSATTLIPSRSFRLSVRLRLNRIIAGLLARTIGLEVRPNRTSPTTGGRAKHGRLILANHVSVLDAIAIASLEDAIFVTSRDITESPPIRWLATIGGAALIERRNRERRDEELEKLESLLREGRTIVIFPEATSTNGSEILRFRSGLLHAAFRVPGVEIIPLCLQYKSIGDEPVTAGNRDRIFLYGEMTIPTHLGRIFTNPRVRLHAEYFAGLPARDFASAGDLAAHVEFLVRSVYRPIRG